MALTLHRSHRLESLADALAAELRTNPAPPLVAERVVVQSLGLRRWLSHRLAEKLGIAMHIEFPFPAQLVEETFAALGTPPSPVFRREILPWRIHAALPSLLNDPDFCPLKNNAAADPRRLWQLAGQIAAVLDRYLAYRPDVLLRWDAGEIRSGEEWQAKLWRAIARGHAHPASLLAGDLHPASRIPHPASRICIFGISTLPPLYIEVLARLAAHADVHLYLLTPTREYWGDLRSAREQARARRWAEKRGANPCALIFSEDHPLLASLGKIGREFHEHLLDLTPEGEPEHFDDFLPPSSLLARLQHSIFTLSLPEEKNPVAPDDRSIQFHNCHSPLRELEVLHDQLLALFQNDALLEPRDVLVAVPDIAAYAPFIEAVFGAAESDRVRFPYAIADRAAHSENAVSSALLRILEVAGSRYTASGVLGLLDCPAIRARFDLSESDIALCRDWVIRSGIRWGLDENHREELGLPKIREHTWRFGLDRLILGFALPPEGDALCAGILPEGGIEGSLAVTLGSFAAFCAQLFDIGEKLAALETNAAAWAVALRAALDALCADDGDFADDFRTIAAQLSAIAEHAKLAGHSAELPFGVIRTHLATALADTDRGGSFLRGGITFCSLKPMRAIPHRIIALLGLDDEKFPRTARPPAYDLTASAPRPGDRTLRDDDRYLFLEAIISARDVLYLSHCGQSARDNTARPPSVLLIELLEHLCRHHALAPGQLTTKHRLQAFSPHYFSGDSLFSFSAENARAAAAIHAGHVAPAPFAIAVKSDAPPTVITLDDLINTLTKPARAFARDRLGMSLPAEATDCEDSEPITLDGLEKWRLSSRLTDAALTGGSVPLDAVAASGALPHGYAGASTFADLGLAAAELAARIRRIAPGASLPPLSVSVASGGIEIAATLAPFTESALVFHRAGKLRGADLLRAWCAHVLLCAAAPASHPRQTALVCCDDHALFPPLAAAAAIAMLESLVALHSRARAAPLPLFAETSCVFAEAKLKWKGPQSADPLMKARTQWEGGYDNKPRVEREDPWLALVWRDIADPLDASFQKLALEVFEPILRALQPPATIAPEKKEERKEMTAPFQLLDTPLDYGVTLLEASAGTGKTYALAAIYLRLVGELGLRPGQIAVTTYTIPATAELRDRIRARLVEAVQAFDGTAAKTPFVAEFAARHAGDAKVRARLADAVRDFDEACISTIHGFCQGILRERAFESGAAPEAELLPDQSEVVRELAEDYWRRHFASAEAGVTPFALLGELTPDALASLHRDTASKFTATLRPTPDGFDSAASALTAHLATFRGEWRRWCGGVRAIFVEQPDWAVGDWKDTANTEAQLTLIEQLCADSASPLGCYEAIAHFRPSHIAKKKGIGTANRQPKPIPPHAFTQWCEDFETLKDSFVAATRAQFLDWARAELPQRKAARDVLGFDDLLTQLHAALHSPGGSALADAIRARFAVALVDEFQDTDPIQDAIFARIFACDTHRLFLIGDPKQAIFAFRGADLFAYLAARKRAARTFALDTNHRSDAALVAAVNALFGKHAQPFVDARITFENAKAARQRNERPLLTGGAALAPMRFWFWESEKAITADRAARELPGIIASAVVRQLASTTLDGVPLKSRDIAVLCTKNAQCQEVQAALAARGVPAVVLSAANVLESDDARELHIVLAALARPGSEGAARAALSTGLFGFDAAALAALGENPAAWENQLAIFQAAHARWRERGFIQMFCALLRDGGIRARLVAQPAGERRLTNLLHLAELLHGAESEFHLGPAALARWLGAEIKAGRGGEERELRLESDDDAVKVLTVHKGKGLEWPVVFCPFGWGKGELHQNELPLFHDEKDNAVLDLGSPDFDAALEAARDEKLAEHMRLLYVALTRARHECHVVWGRFNGCESSAMMWLLHPPTAASDNTYVALTAQAATLDAASLRARLDDLARDESSFAVAPVPEANATRHEPEAVTAPGEARAFSGTLDRTWGVSSFSKLIEGAENEHDYDAAPRIEREELRGIHALPAGAKFGVCVHEIFELLDFTDDAAIEPLVASKLRQHGLHTPERAVALAECVRRTLAHPLGHAGRLTAFPRTRTLRELEFHLPAQLLTPAKLAEFAGAGLAFDPRRGILKGFIDLILEHEGRWYVLDWKSNWLGADAAAYTAEAMDAEMRRHRYGLQLRLYVLALHRHLRVRLPGYDPARHLGGAIYVFLRGLDEANPQSGIVCDTMSAAELAKLEVLFTA